MQYSVSPQDIKQSKIPHELFLTNLIGNHILLAVVVGGLAGTWPWILALVPLISVAILSFILWRARRARTRDSWFVMCHWQVCARRSRIFLGMLGLLLVAVAVGWFSQAHGGMMKEAVWALVAGIGILPVMVTVLVLVIVESDTLHQTCQGGLPDWVAARFPEGAATAAAARPESPSVAVGSGGTLPVNE